MNEHALRYLRRTKPWPLGAVRAVCICGVMFESRDKRWVKEAHADHVWAVGFRQKLKKQRRIGA